MRNVHYGTPSGVKPDSTLAIWQELLDKAAQEKSLLRRLEAIASAVKGRMGYCSCRLRNGGQLIRICVR